MELPDERPPVWKRIAGKVFTRENMLALLLALLLLGVFVFASDTAPTWIYQGF